MSVPCIGAVLRARKFTKAAVMELHVSLYLIYVHPFLSKDKYVNVMTSIAYIVLIDRNTPDPLQQLEDLVVSGSEPTTFR